MEMQLVRNVHGGLPAPENGKSTVVNGDYHYWHYNCDGFDDRGWGCGYRTLQTMASWLRANKHVKAPVPSITEIQRILVEIGDKESSFVHSKSWIGSFEVCLVLDHLYDVRSKILHIRQEENLADHFNTLEKHFESSGCPIMMGGDKDCSSKGIFGIHVTEKGKYLLVMDPHFVGSVKNSEKLQRNGWVRWQNLNEFIDSSFYNLCLPQVN